MVRWIGRLRFVEARQITARFAMDHRNAYRRLRGLVALELLEHRRIFHAEPGAYSATRAGLRAAGLALTPPRVDIRTYHHDRAEAAVMIALEREFSAQRVLTERELRSRDAGAPQRPRYAVWRGAQRTRRGLHFPDLAVEVDGDATLAVEVELSAKGRRRLESIIAAYVRARHVAGVRYYAAPAAYRGVERAVARTGAQSLFEIRTWKESDDSARTRGIAAA